MIIALAGRRIDAAGSDTAYFPLARTAPVRETITNYFKENRPSAVVCSGACGADLLALDIAGKMGIQRYLVLPFPPPLFRERSVADCPGDWGPLFDKIYSELAALQSVIMLNYAPGDEEAYRKTNREILNKVESLSQAAGTAQEEVVALLVWDGKPKTSTDTTAHFGTEARKRNIRTQELLTLN